MDASRIGVKWTAAFGADDWCRPRGSRRQRPGGFGSARRVHGLLGNAGINAPPCPLLSRWLIATGGSASRHQRPVRRRRIWAAGLRAASQLAGARRCWCSLCRARVRTLALVLRAPPEASRPARPGASCGRCSVFRRTRSRPCCCRAGSVLRRWQCRRATRRILHRPAGTIARRSHASALLGCAFVSQRWGWVGVRWDRGLHRWQVRSARRQTSVPRVRGQLFAVAPLRPVMAWCPLTLAIRNVSRSQGGRAARRCSGRGWLRRLACRPPA
jgi:hypothetical protein